MNNPLVSIIIPTFNRAHLIAETLDSVLAQTYENWECIIVDDGSTDNTAEVVNVYVEQDSRFQFHHRPADRLPGGNAARNYGFEVSKGEYVNWLDSDDLFNVNHLYLHINAHLNEKKTIVTVSNAKVFSGNVGVLEGNWSDIVPKNNCILEMINETVSWPICGVVWSRDSVGLNLFKEDLVSSQEWTFHLLQLIENKVLYKIINVDSCFVRKHEFRIGKLKTEGKIKSTFMSRWYIYDSLNKNGYYDSIFKLKLIDRFIKAIRDSLCNKYYSLFWSMYRLFILKIFKINERFKLYGIVFFWIPLYFITAKGYKYLKYNIEK